ncbi:MAG: YicC family protein [Blautia sp.]|nr:YicC family protein [Blautia sp.]
MVKSMTGFGRAEAVTSSHRISAELKSVNHRYLDLSIKMPRKLGFLEGQVRSLIKEYAERGKIDVYIIYEDYSASDAALKCNQKLAASYLHYLRKMSSEFGLTDDIRTSTLIRLPEVFSMEEQSLDEEELWEEIAPVLRSACDKFVETRVREGGHLCSDLLEKLDGLKKKVIKVQERSPIVLDLYREKIEGKVKELLSDTSIEDARIAAEVVLFADKICNDEETVRLLSHIEGMRKMLLEKEGIGRKLDFMAQEMNREANTILSKSADLEVSELAIDLKTEIEKIREQIQNLE